MKSFLEFLLLNEGGNVKVTYQGNEVGADSINLEKRSRTDVQNDIHGFLSDLHDHVNKNHGVSLFGKNKTGLKKKTIFSGSTKPLMDKDITDNEYVHGMGKKEVGDIDTMVRGEHIVKGGPLESSLKPGSQFGKFTVAGTKRVGTQLHAIIRHNETGNHHQVDFATADYDGEHPSEFAQVGTNSHPEDMRSGLKGVDHKHLWNAAIKASSGFHGRVVDRKGNVKEEGFLPHRTFSTSAGMRDSYEPTGEVEDGVQLAKKITPSKKMSIQYDKNLKSIAKKTFGKPNAELDSFHGIARSMKKHFNHEQIGRALTIFKSNMDDNPRLSTAMNVLKGHFESSHPEHFG